LAEEEELRLVVRVDDESLARINELRDKVRSLGTGEQAAGVERMRKETNSLTESLVKMTGSFGGLARGGFILGFFGALGEEVQKLGMDLLNRATDFSGYSNGIVDLANNARAAGTNMAQFRETVNVFKESGVSADAASQQIRKFSDVYADLQEGQRSTVRRQLMVGLPTREDVENMQGLIARMMSGNQEQALNEARNFAQRIREYWTRLGRPETGAAGARELLERLGIPDVDKVRGTFRTITEEQRALYDSRVPEARRTQEDLAKVEDAWERIGTSMAATGLQALGINTKLEGMLGFLEGAAEKAERFETTLRDSKDIAAATTELLGKLVPTPQSVEENLNRNRQAQEAAGGHAVRNVTEDIARRTRDAFLGTFGLQRPSMYGSTAGGAPFGAYRAYRQHQREQERPRVAPPPEQPAPRAPDVATAQPAPEPSPEQRAAAELSIRTYSARQRRAEPEPAAAPAEGPAPVPLPRARPADLGLPADIPLPTPRPDAARVSEEHAAALDENTRALKSLADKVGERPRPPTQVETRMGGLETGKGEGTGITRAPVAPEGPMPTQRQPEPPTFDQRWNIPAVAQPDRPAPAEPPPTVPPQQHRPEPQVLTGTGQPQPKPPAAALPPPVQKPQEQSWLGSIGAGLERYMANVATAITASQGQAPADDRMKQREAWSSASMPEAAAALDRASRQNVDVSGSAKISVDVNAPPGTRVGAQAEGLFKSTEITRSTQMLPAESGPLPETGVGAGAGTLSTGTQ
jgi:hypothetical protein